MALSPAGAQGAPEFPGISTPTRIPLSQQRPRALQLLLWECPHPGNALSRQGTALGRQGEAPRVIYPHAAPVPRGTPSIKTRCFCQELPPDRCSQSHRPAHPGNAFFPKKLSERISPDRSGRSQPTPGMGSRGFPELPLVLLPQDTRGAHGKPRSHPWLPTAQGSKCLNSRDFLAGQFDPWGKRKQLCSCLGQFPSPCRH